MKKRLDIILVEKGLAPSRDNIFYYSVGKSMEKALIKE